MIYIYFLSNCVTFVELYLSYLILTTPVLGVTCQRNTDIYCTNERTLFIEMNDFTSKTHAQHCLACTG